MAQDMLKYINSTCTYMYTYDLVQFKTLLENYILFHR